MWFPPPIRPSFIYLNYKTQNPNSFFFFVYLLSRQDKPGQDNVLFGVLCSPMYIDFIQLI